MPNQEPLFTVVMAVSRDGWRVARAIERLAQQDIGFSAHAELLLVRAEGDGPFPLCDEALSSIRESVRAVDGEALGHRELWRLAMARARGRFIAFVHESDQLAPHTLTAVRAAAEGWGERLPPVLMTPAIRGLIGEARLEGWDRLPAEGGLIDLADHPDAFPVKLAGLFFDAAAVRAADATILAEPDESLHVLDLMRSLGSSVGFVSGPGVGLACAGRGDRTGDPEADYERLQQTVDYFEGMPAADLDRTARSAMLFLLRDRLSRLSDDWFADGGEEREFKHRVRALVERVPTPEFHASRWLRDLPFRYLLASAAFLDMPWAIGEGGKVCSRDEAVFDVSEFPVEVMRLNPRRDGLEIEAIFQNHFAGDLDVVLVSDSGESVSPVEGMSGGEGPTRQVAGRVTSLVHYRRFVVPAASGTSWRFAFVSPRFSGHVFARNLSHHAKTVFSRDPERRRQFGPGYFIDFSPERGYALRAGGGGWLAYRVRRAREHRREFGKFPWSVLASARRKRLILINDRVKYGNDSGEALFRYIQEHRPELRRRTWFVLDESAPSYEELASTGRVVRPRTFKHRVLYLNARLHFSSHVPATYNSPWHRDETSFLSDFFDPTFVWIRHGVTMNRVDKVYNRFNADIDGIVASAGYEKEYLEREGSFFTANSVVASGLPRFDRLSDTSREQRQRSLLYMPTWRSWLAGGAQTDGSRGAVEGFEESEYFLQQRRLMTDPDVLAALEAADARFEFLTHPVMAAYQEHYDALASDRVAVLDQASTSYSDLFARGAAMITDYSSVFVDFSYLRKPVLFDQSDEERFRAGHYTAGLFDYETQAPGPVLRDFAALKQAVLDLIRSGFAVDERYASRLDDFFLHSDRSNSARALEAGIRIDERRRGAAFRR